ncbi:MAG: LysR family transcriptional regulator [Hyphomicrobiaceae bacterium]|nr:LysR family transcriptional regulator [Hyphomicrobiaceae bacterium]
MDIQDLRIFARVAAVQNLSSVGTELGLTPGTISKRIQALEDELHVRLFDRTTRSIRITEEGATFLSYVGRILVELESARASVGDFATRPKGKLKISAPASFGRLFVAPAISAFMGSYPEIEIHINMTDRVVNLQEEGYDVAIRTGLLTDSALIAKRLYADRQVVVASPAYLDAHGTPKTPADLSGHNCFVLGDNWQWSFCRGNDDITVRVSGRLRSNNGEVLRQAALDGHGLFQTSELRVREELATGQLVRVLAEFELLSSAAVWAVYPSSKHVLPKLRALLDFLAAWFREACSEPARTATPAVNGGLDHGAGKDLKRAPAPHPPHSGVMLP